MFLRYPQHVFYYHKLPYGFLESTRRTTHQLTSHQNMAEHQMQHNATYEASIPNMVEYGLFVAQQHVDLNCRPACGITMAHDITCTPNS
jgi:hypothetical protein